MKRLACGDLVPGCDYVARAETEDEVVAMAARHAQSVHDLSVTPTLAAKVRAAIREE